MDDLFNGIKLPDHLTKKQIYELFKRYKDGDKEARNTIILCNMKLVLYRIYKRFNTLPYDKEELVSIGLIGLIKGVDTFNISKNVSFSSYATVCIDNEILMFMRKNKNFDNIASLDEAIKQIDNGDRLITIKEILRDEQSDIILDYENVEMIKILREIICELNEIDQEIVKLYFGFYDKRYTKAEIADKYNCTLYQITILKKRILLDLKNKLKEKGISKKLK